MKNLLFGLVLVALPALGDGGAPVRLYTSFQQAPPDAIRDVIRDEVARIMSPMGLAFKWIPLGENKGRESSLKLAVIHFTGHCDVANLAALNSHPGALGWTHVADGVILPFSDIDCDAIRAFVGGDLLAKPIEDRQEAFGRAVGRVLAHELYHVFANTTRHGSQGVSKSCYSAQELLSKSFQFEQKEGDELRRHWSDVVASGF